MRGVLVTRALGVVLSAMVGASALAGGTKVGLIEFEGAPSTRPGPMAWLGGEQQPSLLDLAGALRRAGERDDLAGVVIRLKDAKLKVSETQELGQAMQALRAKGKKVHVYAEAYGQGELALASFADEVLVQDGGPVSLPGIYMEEMFLADTLGWVGLKANMVQVGDYKGASEPMARNAPSPQWEQNINGLLDSMYANLRDQIKSGRRMNDEQLDAAMRQGWLADSADAVKLHLVDRACDFATLSEDLKKAYAGDVAWDRSLLDTNKTKLDAGNPFAMLAMLSKKPDNTPKVPSIGILHIDGAIVDGDGKDGGLFGGEGNVGSRTIRRAIEEIIEQDQIKGVIVRIDSPGGSATASEVIWQGLRRLAAKKPVWASVGSMAASGGYYIAVGTDKIYVNPSSIVGSIGVVGGKISMGGLYDLVKVRVYPHARGPAAGMFRSTTDWTPEELAMVRGKMTQTYDQFTRRVTAGRKGIDLATTAEGRLFTGDKAIGLKMADKVGSLQTALDDLGASLGLSKPGVVHYPSPKSLDEVLQDAFKQFAAAPGVGNSRSPSPLVQQVLGTLKDVVGDAAWPSVRTNLQGLWELRREPVLLMMPAALVDR